MFVSYLQVFTVLRLRILTCLLLFIITAKVIYSSNYLHAENLCKYLLLIGLAT